MKHRDLALDVALALSLVIIGLVAYLDSDSVWGLNHTKYLGAYNWYSLAVLAALVIVLILAPWRRSVFERGAQATAGWLWGKSIWPRIVVPGCLAGLFYLFRVSTAFLGDGYFLLNVFGRNEAYTANLIKPLSIWIIKAVQTMYGGYTYWTALYTFQTVSIVSGFFVIYNFIAIAGLLTESARGRLYALGTMIASGWLLLFFGYIEYYPMLWLAASFFVRQSIRCVRGEASRWMVWLTFVITTTIHMQALYFLPGVLFLQFRESVSRFVDNLSTTARRIIMTIGLLVPIAIVLVSGNWLSGMTNPFLPLLPFGVDWPHYAVFSLGNLFEIASLVLLLVPTVILLLALAFTTGARPSDSLSRLLGLFALGSLFFLALMNPKFGLARDWDLMSLTLLAPTLYLLHRVAEWWRVKVELLCAGLVLSLFVTGTYLNANCTRALSERRYFDLLEHYGSREPSGWESLARYLEHEGRHAFHDEVTAQMAVFFPERIKLETAKEHMARGELEEAELLLLELVESHPNHGLYLSTLGDVRVNQGRIDEAMPLYQAALVTHPNHRNYFLLGKCHVARGEYAVAIRYLEQAHQISPLQVEVLVELCRTYATLGQLAPAGKYADELLAIDPRAPDGLITAIVVAARSGDRNEARRHYREFLQYGRDHPEYETIKASFADLVR